MFSKFNLLKQLGTYILISMAFSLNACGGMHIHSDDDLQLIKEKTFKISPGKNLIVDISSGDVTVTYWDKSEVCVKIFGNEKAFEKMNFTLEGNEESVEVIGKKKSSTSSWFSSVNVEAEIKVPSNFNLDINTAGGDIKCGGINGRAQLNTSGGDVWADKFSGDLYASTSGGDVFLFCNNAFEQMQEVRMNKTLKTESTNEWQAIGPHNTGGRTNAIAFNPQNPNTIYAGSASGGLWRSYTGGVGVDAWYYVPTGIPILGVSSITFAPNDSNIIYIGTGEVYNYAGAGYGAAYRNLRGTYGMGILKTTDGGQSWVKS